MSSRSIRRLQGNNPLENINDELSDVDDVNSCCRGARRKVLPSNPFGLLDDDKSPEQSSDEKCVDDDEPHVPKVANSKKKKKKKIHERKNRENSATLRRSSETTEDDILDMQLSSQNSTETSDGWNNEKVKKDLNLLQIKVKNLNINYELRRIFGSSIVENTNNRRRTHGKLSLKPLSLVNRRENWPPLNGTGISMKMEKVDGVPVFTYVHSPDYQKTQRLFLEAVESLNPDNIIAILNSHPYHVDTLIQLSDLCSLSDDLQGAAELIERALYCLESAFHHQFNIARGNCHLDYRHQVNRPLFICIFKHLNFVGERACYLTALELCKLLLLLDFDSDPLAVVLCIDFYALRSRNYAWLLDVAKEWESKKNLSQLPNFAFSTALAQYYLAEASESKDFSEADSLLQDALLLFPGVLKQLLEKCNIQCDAEVSCHPFFSVPSVSRQSNSLKALMSLYVNRTYHEWKNPKILPWLEKNVHAVLQRVNALDPLVEEYEKRRQIRYSGISSNVLRHIILSDIKDVTSIVSDVNSSFVSFDPIPPVDSINIYQRQSRNRVTDRSSSLSLFFRSILPSFNLNTPPEDLNRDNGVADNINRPLPVQEPGQVPGGHAPALQETLQHSVAVLMDAIALLLTNIHARGRELEDDIALWNENLEAHGRTNLDQARRNNDDNDDNADNPRSNNTD